MKTWERLKSARDSRGWSQKDMADKLGISQQVYSYYENGRELKTGMILQICAVLECSPNWLLGYHDEGMHLASDSLLLHQLREAFDQLNDTGQQEAVKRVQELTHVPTYTGQVKNGGSDSVREVM